MLTTTKGWLAWSVGHLTIASHHLSVAQDVTLDNGPESSLLQQIKRQIKVYWHLTRLRRIASSCSGWVSGFSHSPFVCAISLIQEEFSRKFRISNLASDRVEREREREKFYCSPIYWYINTRSRWAKINLNEIFDFNSLFIGLPGWLEPRKHISSRSKNAFLPLPTNAKFLFGSTECNSIAWEWRTPILSWYRA